MPIDPCTASQILLNEQRYALAVMYFSLGGDNWNAGKNPGNNPGNNRKARNGRNTRVDKGAPSGTWLSGLNYCQWGTEISGANGSYNQLVCDEFGNVLNLNLRKSCAYCNSNWYEFRNVCLTHHVAHITHHVTHITWHTQNPTTWRASSSSPSTAAPMG